MTALEKIESLLRRTPGRMYCDDCLSRTLAIRPRQQVEQKTLLLSNDHRYWRGLAHCAECNRDKLMICFRSMLDG